MDDKEIYDRIKSDKQNFAILYDQYFVPIKKYILRRIGNYDISCDVTAETFLKAYLKVNYFEYRGISYKVWLYRIATNEVNLFFRSKKYKPLNKINLEDFNNETLITSQQEDKDIWEKELQDHHDFLKAQQVIKNLPIKYAEVLSLRYFEKASIKEIAEILDKPKGTIKSLCTRGLQKVKEKMQPGTES